MSTCKNCLKDPRVLSLDKTHRLCGKCCAEVNRTECEYMRDDDAKNLRFEGENE